MYLNSSCIVRCMKKKLTQMVVDMDHKCIPCANITCNIAQSYTLSDLWCCSFYKRIVLNEAEVL